MFRLKGDLQRFTSHNATLSVSIFITIKQILFTWISLLHQLAISRPWVFNLTHAMHLINWRHSLAPCRVRSCVLLASLYEPSYRNLPGCREYASFVTVEWLRLNLHPHAHYAPNTQCMGLGLQIHCAADILATLSEQTEKLICRKHYKCQ